MPDTACAHLRLASSPAQRCRCRSRGRNLGRTYSVWPGRLPRASRAQPRGSRPNRRLQVRPAREPQRASGASQRPSLRAHRHNVSAKRPPLTWAVPAEVGGSHRAMLMHAQVPQRATGHSQRRPAETAAHNGSRCHAHASCVPSSSPRGVTGRLRRSRPRKRRHRPASTKMGAVL